jgi:hypothetical protein
MNNSIVWISIANLFYLASYSVREILWLRVLSLAGAALLIPFYALQGPPLLPALVWDVIFIAINAYWIARLIVERRPVWLSADEARLRILSFPTLTPIEARKLFSTGRWESISAGISLLEHDRAGMRLSVIARGRAEVVHNNVRVAELSDGQFVGAIVLRSHAAELEVLSLTESLIICWPCEALEA